MWDPFTLLMLSYLRGHNTSVLDVSMNEERNHLISLGTDKSVKVWNTHTYQCVYNIYDNVKPEYQLNSLTFCNRTNNIVLGSRKVNLWPFRTQEEISTSHECEVAYALYNHEFDSVISCDDSGFVNIWDIENGQLMSKYCATEGAP
jgi:WD40 repeat protein